MGFWELLDAKGRANPPPTANLGTAPTQYTLIYFKSSISKQTKLHLFHLTHPVSHKPSCGGSCHSSILLISVPIVISILLEFIIILFSSVIALCLRGVILFPPAQDSRG